MQPSEFEAAIADFLALGRKLKARSPLTGEQVLAELRQLNKPAQIVSISVHGCG